MTKSTFRPVFKMTYDTILIAEFKIVVYRMSRIKQTSVHLLYSFNIQPCEIDKNIPPRSTEQKYAKPLSAECTSTTIKLKERKRDNDDV